jgi:hypothetical protein
MKLRKPFCLPAAIRQVTPWHADNSGADYRSLGTVSSCRCIGHESPEHVHNGHLLWMKSGFRRVRDAPKVGPSMDEQQRSPPIILKQWAFTSSIAVPISPQKFEMCPGWGATAGVAFWSRASVLQTETVEFDPPPRHQVLRVGSGRLGAVLIRQFRLVQLQRRAPIFAPVADGEASGLQSRDWVFESPPECQVQKRARGRVDSGSGLLNRNTLVLFQPGVPESSRSPRGVVGKRLKPTYPSSEINLAK